jgi:hypothetical protein
MKNLLHVKLAGIVISCLALLMPLMVVGGVAADVVPACTSSNISNYVQEGVNDATGQEGCGQAGGNIDDSVSAIASKVVNVFSIIVGVVAVIMVIYGGFRYIISGGDSGRVGTAKNTLIYAIIGLIIVALAQLIVRYVLSTANSIGTTTTVGLAVNSLIR